MSIFNLLVGSTAQQSAGGSGGGGGATPDYTPTVSGTWSDIFDTSTGVGNTGNVTINDINQTIQLYWTNGAGDSDSIFVRASVNDGTYSLLSEGSGTVSVTNGDTVKWQVETFQTTIQSGTITIKNNSDSGATVGNTFDYSVRII